MRILILLLSALMAFTTAGCSTKSKKALGLQTPAPDEFRVVSNPNLVVPPSFDLTPPLTPDANLNATSDKARALVYAPAQGETAAPLSDGTQRLLARAGVNESTDSDARAALQSEDAVTQGQKEGGIVDRLKSISQDATATNELVDPVAERQRLEDNKKMGKSVNEGDTPMIKQRKSAWDAIFKKKD